MNYQTGLKAALSTLVAVLFASSSFAEDFGKIPYAKLHEIFTRGANVKNPNVRAAVAVIAKDTNVKPAEVTLTIQAKSGPIKVPVEADGEIRSFPMKQELLKENPFVVTNQRKGKAGIRGTIVIVPPDGMALKYERLYELLEQANAEVKKQAGLLSAVTPRARTLVFQFRKPQQQTLTIGLKGGAKTLTANAEGAIWLAMDKELLVENPTVTVSEKPSKIAVEM